MTTSTFNQLPGVLNVAVKKGNFWSTTIDFSIPLTGYTVTAGITTIPAGAATGTITATLADAAAGVVAVQMTSPQTQALPAGTYKWNLTWNDAGGGERTALAGFLEVVP